jgi:hypothetical protein
MLGNGGAVAYGSKIGASKEEMVNAGSALASGAVYNFVGTAYRVRWVITDGGGDKTFTFSVTMLPG